jgi:RNA-directed DNA polymerase
LDSQARRAEATAWPSAALEDKVVQQAVKTVLECIYEQDFLGFSYGFRPGRGGHDALDALGVGLSKRKVNWVLDKTRLLEFGRFAAENRGRRGEGKPETFDFLGFTHYCGTTRKGTFQVKRKSIAKRLRAKLQAVKLELRRRMHARVAALGEWLRSVVRGWFQYHAVPDNFPALDEFRKQVARLWRAALRRRSQKRSGWTWDRLGRLVDRRLPSPKILHPYPDRRLIVSNPR